MTTLLQSFSVSNGVIGAPVATVPEPETYDVLLASLALVGLASRRGRGESNTSAKSEDLNDISLFIILFKVPRPFPIVYDQEPGTITDII